MLRLNIVRGVGRRFYTVVGSDAFPANRITFEEVKEVCEKIF